MHVVIPRLNGMSVSLFVQTPVIWPSNVVMSSTPNQVHSLLLAYHQAMSLWLRKKVPCIHPFLLDMYVNVVSNHTPKLVSLQKWPINERHQPSTLEIEKNESRLASIPLQPKELSYCCQVHILYKMFQIYNVSMYPNLRSCMKVTQSHRQQRGPIGVRSPYPQQPTKW
jgi:hypothetical protein